MSSDEPTVPGSRERVRQETVSALSPDDTTVPGSGERVRGCGRQETGSALSPDETIVTQAQKLCQLFRG